MINSYRKILLPIFFSSEFLATLFAYLLSHFILFRNLFLKSEYWSLLYFIVLIKLVLILLFKTYHSYIGDRLKTRITECIICQFVFLIGLSVYVIVFNNSKNSIIANRFLFLFILTNFGLLIFLRLIRHKLIEWYCNGKKCKKVLLLELNSENGDYDHFSFSSEYQIAKKLHPSNKKESETLPDFIQNEVKNTNYDILLISLPHEPVDQLNQIIRAARKYGLKILLTHKFTRSLDKKFKIDYIINDLPFIEISD